MEYLIGIFRIKLSITVPHYVYRMILARQKVLSECDNSRSKLKFCHGIVTVAH